MAGVVQGSGARDAGAVAFGRERASRRGKLSFVSAERRENNVVPLAFTFLLVSAQKVTQKPETKENSKSAREEKAAVRRSIRKKLAAAAVFFCSAPARNCVVANDATTAVFSWRRCFTRK